MKEDSSGLEFYMCVCVVFYIAERKHDRRSNQRVGGWLVDDGFCWNTESDDRVFFSLIVFHINPIYKRPLEVTIVVRQSSLNLQLKKGLFFCCCLLMLLFSSICTN